MERQPSMKLDMMSLMPDPLLEPEPKTLSKEELDQLTRAAATMMASHQYPNKQLPGTKTLEEKPEKSNNVPESDEVCRAVTGSDDEDPQPNKRSD